MKWEQRDDGDGHRCLIVEAAWDEVAHEYDDVVARYENAPMPGFRAGRAPRIVVEQRFRKAISGDLSRITAERLGRDAIREAGLEPLGPLEATDIEWGRNETFRVRLRFWPMPEITLPDLDSLAIIEDGSDPIDQISQALLERVRFDLPLALVREEVGVDEEWPAAESRVRLMLILKSIARQEGLEIDGTDIEKRISQKAREFETTASALRTQLGEGGLQKLRDVLLAERTLEYLIEKATRRPL